MSRQKFIPRETRHHRNGFAEDSFYVIRRCNKRSKVAHDSITIRIRPRAVTYFRVASRNDPKRNTRIQILAGEINVCNYTLHLRAPWVPGMPAFWLASRGLRAIKLIITWVPPTSSRAPPLHGRSLQCGVVTGPAQSSWGMFRRPSANSLGEDNVELDGIPLADLRSRGQCCS